MASFGIVPALYPFEDGVGKLVAGLPFFRAEYFELHGAPEGLHHGIVIAILDGAYGSEWSRRAEAFGRRPKKYIASRGQSAISFVRGRAVYRVGGG